MRDEAPLLIPRQNVTENWTDLFCVSLPKLHELAMKIVVKKEWDAEGLLDLMRNELRVPYLGTKTARLAVRWLHELVSGIKIDMSTYKIPIDSLVYRVLCRLGIIDPNIDRYSGEGSPADIKIQAFVTRVLPDKPWLLDEPLWSTGRQPDKGGHCFPKHPDCSGCLFGSICQRRYTDVDPSQIGMETSSIVGPLADFWPENGPQWDALGKSDSRKLFLVEAKSHISELISSIEAKDENSVRRIRLSLEETKDFLNSNAEVDWSRGFYHMRIDWRTYTC